MIRALKLTPVVQFSRLDIAGTSTGDVNRTAIGANYRWVAYNANVKALHTRIAPRGLIASTSSPFS